MAYNPRNTRSKRIRESSESSKRSKRNVTFDPGPSRTFSGNLTHSTDDLDKIHDMYERRPKSFRLYPKKVSAHGYTSNPLPQPLPPSPTEKVTSPSGPNPLGKSADQDDETNANTKNNTRCTGCGNTPCKGCGNTMFEGCTICGGKYKTKRQKDKKTKRQKDKKTKDKRQKTKRQKM